MHPGRSQLSDAAREAQRSMARSPLSSRVTISCRAVNSFSFNQANIDAIKVSPAPTVSMSLRAGYTGHGADAVRLSPCEPPSPLVRTIKLSPAIPAR